LIMNPVPWLQMTNMISYQGLVRTFLNSGSDKRVSFVSILFFAHVGIYERDHKQTFGPGALFCDLALFYVAVGELSGAG
ncbi:hypothetical protein QP556_03590, partial [Citrobacter freundii]|nr:hypothetical protein [Citrobacter freundii]